MAPRLLRHPVAEVSTLDPAAVFRALHGDAGRDAFWLDDALGWSIIGTGRRWRFDGPVLEALASQEAAWRADPLLVDPADAEGAPPFRPGLVGWLGYGVARETVGLPDAGGSVHPDAAFLVVDRAVAVGPDRGGARRVELLAAAPAWTGATASWRDRTVARLRALTVGSSHGVPAGAPDPGPATDPALPATDPALSSTDPAPPATVPAAPSVHWRDTRGEYLAAVHACQAAIARGDAYVLNLSTEIEVTPASGTRFAALDLYDRLRAISPAPHGGVLRIDGVTLLSSSPERFVRVADGVVSTHPVKGTRRRSADPRIDTALRDELAGNVKERAENVMIVDLVRNDLARVSVPGGVEVTSLLEVETHPRVHQLVSAVSARLRDGAGVAEVLAAAFPAGSMTGAPKRSAVAILAGLERRARGLYAGAFGSIGRDGSADLAMVIRSIVLDAQGATVGVGGGVTALSVPEEEYEEVLLKASALLEALGAEPSPGAATSAQA